MNSEKYPRGKFPIAIVGIGCRLPGSVRNPQDFWDVLVQGRDTIAEVPPHRWEIDSWHDPDQSNYTKMVSRRCGFIDDVDMFDNAFFKISPREAASMDPQQRQILEVTYEAFQDAGVIPESLGDSCGVYIGTGLMDYAVMICRTELLNPYTHTGIAHSSIANRISYVFNLRGPSMAVDTACAASVNAIHLACSGLWDEECSIAVAGGCNGIFLPETTIGFSALGVLSPEGKSCPFSDTAQGYVRGEGWGSLILKPLDDALANNDHVYAVIRGCGVAANGSNQSITMPSAEAQEMLIRKTYKRFDIPLSSVSYVEAHGTGTPVGDPIEAEAIGLTFGPERATPIKVGSVKSNFGHNECAAGVVAAIKVSLMLHNKRLVPTINYNDINPAIDLKKLNLQIQTDTEEIEDDDKPYTIGLNSFGFVGAVAHVVFQEAPPLPSKPIATCGWSFGSESTSKGNAIVVPLSAKTQEALKELAVKWSTFVCSNDALSVSSWQATRRDHHQYRLTVIADSAASFRNVLTSYVEDEGSVSLMAGTANQKNPKICFVFPGQGQQWVDMGRKLFQEEPVFHDTIIECDAIFKQVSGWSVLETCCLFQNHDGRNTSLIPASEAVKLIHVIQPAIFFIQVGIYNLWRHWGVEPHVVVGHSLGETAAAYVCGGMTLQEAITVIYHRSREQAKLVNTGRMAALRATAKQARAICDQRQGVYISAVNGPGDVTLGGDTDEIAALVAENPGKAKQLRVTCPFHTPVMDPIKKPFVESMKGVVTTETGKRTIPYYSTVTGHYYQGAFDTEYWWNNIRKPVLFQQAVEEILQDTNIDIFLEVSAAATLLASVKQIIRSVDPQQGISTIYSGLRDKDDLHSIQRALGSLYVAGVDINWSNVTKNAAQWAPIPTYPWQHKCFWSETEEKMERRLGLDDRSFKGRRGEISLADYPFLADHQLDNRIVFPGAGYVEYLVEMNFQAEEAPTMTDLSFTKVLAFPEESDNRKAVVTLYQTDDSETVQVKCGDNIHCKATICTKSDRRNIASSLSAKDILQRCNKAVSRDEIFSMLEQSGFQYGPAFQVVEKAFIGEGESIAYLTPITQSSQRISIPHLDATFQLAQVTADAWSSMFLPVHIDYLHVTNSSLPTGETLVVHTQILDCDSHFLTADIIIARESGTILAEVKGYRGQNFHGNQTDVDIDTCIYTTKWQPVSASTPSPKIIEDIFTESHLRTTYTDEMNAICRVENVLHDFEAICASYIKNALETVPKEERAKPQTYKKYISRLEKIASLDTAKRIPHDKIPEVWDRIQTQCPEFGTEVGLIRSLGEALPDTLRDPQVAMPIMFSPEGLHKYFYDSLCTRIYYKAVAEAITQVVEESLKCKHVVRILEIGGRLGGLARYILEPLKEFGMSHQLEYVFTDFNATFFKQAEDNLAEFPFIQYKPLNIETEVSQQGFVPGSFDIVIALDTLHASIDVHRTTGDMSKLLLPNGLMFIIEATSNLFEKELCFATLDVCWLFDDFREERCWLDRQGWVDIMTNVGFQEVASASTPNDFFHGVIVGRSVKDNASSNINGVNVELSNLLIVQDKSNTFGEEIQSLYKGGVDIKSFSDTHWFQGTLEKHTGTPTELIYVYSDDDSKLHALLELLQAVEQCPQSVNRVWVLSSGANKDPSNPNASTAIGFSRAISNHIPNVPVFSIDFDPTCSMKENVKTLTNFMEESDMSEREIVIRNGVRHVPVIVHQELSSRKKVSENWRVEQAISARGHERSIDDLALHDVQSYDIPPGHIKISIRAAPLNFKDVMMSMGLLQGLELEDFPSFGIECAGVVAELGEGVSCFKTGDEVIAFGKKCFASHVICNAELATLKPHNLDWIESASIGIVFVTAYLSLVERGRLKPKETVLIHSACGGVGLAAIQIARMLGAKIICTAGSRKKREYLKNVLGVRFVSDSRSTQFYDDVMSFTEGRGVDVVLNSLSGKLLSTSMSVLAPCGRFCEIGKRDILQNSNLPMKILLENKFFISCQVDILMQQNPSTVKRLLQKVVNLFENSELHPIPTTVYSMKNFTEAFRVMSKGSHIGKMVFKIDGLGPQEVRPAVQQFPSKATYIVTGGFGGIGQALARWLCDNGAKHIVLISRNGPGGAAARRMIKYIQSKGVNVHQFNIDVSDYQSVKGMLEGLREDKRVPPIKGVFHLAGIIEEGSFSSLTNDEMDQMLGGKTSGAYHLHTLTKQDSLDIFFLLSSVMVVWGNPAQPAYIAANNYLDALAVHRHSQGLPALSIQLGPVRGAGFLEGPNKDDLLKALKMKGNLLVHVDEFLHVLGRLLLQKGMPVVCLANMDWRTTQQFCHESMLKFRHLTAIKRKAAKADIAIGKEDVEEGMKLKMAEILCMPVDAIDVNQPMINYGVDSLVAIELVSWASNHLGLTISQLDILSGITTATLLQKVIEQTTSD